jgi:hypothetical protein
MRNEVGYTIFPPLWLGPSPVTPDGRFGPEPIVGEVFSGTAENGMKIKALRHGHIVHDFGSSDLRSTGGSEIIPPEYSLVYNPVMRRITMMSLYLACFYSAVVERHNLALKKMALEPSDLLHYRASGVGWSGFSLAGYTAMLPVAPADPFDERIRARFTAIDVTCLQVALDRLNAVIRHDMKFLPEVIEIVLRACELCEDFNFSACLITSWGVTERLIGHRWRKFIEQSEATGTRRQTLLTDHRTYTAAVRLEFLAFADQITPDLFVATSDVRRARNAWMHELKPVDHTTAFEAVETALSWIRSETGIALKLPASLHINF